MRVRKSFIFFNNNNNISCLGADDVQRLGSGFIDSTPVSSTLVLLVLRTSAPHPYFPHVYFLLDFKYYVGIVLGRFFKMCDLIAVHIFKLYLVDCCHFW